jgi:hypothetical protein
MNKPNEKTPFPFARAYDFILADKHLCAAEKLVLIEICRYWPNPCYEAAKTIAQKTGMDKRYVRNLITGLTQGTEKRTKLGKPPRKAYIARAYSHYQKNGQSLTVRVIKCLCFPDTGGARGEPLSARGQPPPQVEGVRKDARGQPPNRSLSREENRSDAPPLPASGQASPSPTEITSPKERRKILEDMPDSPFKLAMLARQPQKI